MRTMKKLQRKQSGIALITSLLLMVLMASLLAGFICLVIAEQQVMNSSANDNLAFYGAQAGLEKLTGDLGTLFGNNYAPTGPEINALTTAPPDLSAQGLTFTDPNNVSTYSITFAPDAKGNPAATPGTINNGNSPWNGMTALLTQYNLNATAWTKTGSQVQLTRSAQSVGIPLFQFGIFSQTDLGFHAGVDFNFGGRVHTNGNLFLAQDTGTLTMSQKVTAVKQVVRNNLMNGYSIISDPGYQGTVSITKGSGAYRALAFGEGSVTGMPNSSANPNWTTQIEPAYNGNLVNNVKPLNLTIALLGAADPIELIRRPAAGESPVNPMLGERYFAQASLKILLSDNSIDISNLPCTDTTVAPFNLAELAQPFANWPADTANLQAKMGAAGTSPLPLAASGATAATYTPGTGTPPGDGYWVKNGQPTLTANPGYIKIEVQTGYGSPCGGWKDVTAEILGFGYVAANLNPGPRFADSGTKIDNNWKYTGAAYNTNPVAYGGASFGADYRTVGAGTSGTAPPILYPLGVGAAGVTCNDPHPNAIIRLERVRDNPSSIPYCQQNGNACNASKGTLPQTQNYNLCGFTSVGGVDPSLQSHPSDFWPLTLYDTREGISRDAAPGTGLLTLGGTMHYVELNVTNLAKWFTGKLAGVTTSAYTDPGTAPNNYLVYFSDRRGNYVPKSGLEAIPGGWPPQSPSNNETGEYGFSDSVNPASQYGCPNGTLDTGEDLDNLGVLFTYGQDPTHAITSLYSTFWPSANGMLTAAPSPLKADPNCTVANPTTVWPGTFVQNTNEARQNPPLFFRRALKLTHGNLISVTGWQANCGGSGNPCGLAIAAENPIYVQGDYNANSGGGNFADPNVAASVMGDAVTLLSNSWNDLNSFSSPYLGAGCSGGARTATTTYYRMGVLAGKGLAFPLPSWSPSNEFGDDGGIHNFMRFLEDWGNQTAFYDGSIGSLYYNRQAIGTWKYSVNCAVYIAPTRNYIFDTNFLTPSLLPPRTPMFRDINITGFTQILVAD